MLTHSSKGACTLFVERLSHLERTLAQCKGTQKEMLVKLGFLEKRADAEMMDRGDQIRHGHQEWENGKLPGLSRFVLREGVRTAERQPGVGIFCCRCWLAGKTLDLFLAARDYQAALEAAEAEAAAEAAVEAGTAPAHAAVGVAAAAADAPGQEQMGAGAAPQTLARIDRMPDNIWEVVRQPRHSHWD